MTGGNFRGWVAEAWEASLVAQTVKNLPAVQESRIRSVGWEDPLEEDTATRSRVLAGRIPTERGAWLAIVARVTKSLMTEAT